jgi:protein TonB
MNSSRQLILFIFISLIIHTALISLITQNVQPEPEAEVKRAHVVMTRYYQKQPEPAVESKPAPPPEIESKLTPEPKPAPPSVSEPVPVSETVVEPPPEAEKPLPEPEQASSDGPDAARSEAAEESSEETSASTAAPPPQKERSAGNPFTGLLQRINAARDSTYPLIAKKRGWQGRVVVQIRLDIEGELLSVQIIEGSKYPVFDDAASDLVSKVLERPYPHYLGREVVLKLPITYRLR